MNVALSNHDLYPRLSIDDSPRISRRVVKNNSSERLIIVKIIPFGSAFPIYSWQSSCVNSTRMNKVQSAVPWKFPIIPNRNCVALYSLIFMHDSNIIYITPGARRHTMFFASPGKTFLIYSTSDADIPHRQWFIDDLIYRLPWRRGISISVWPITSPDGTVSIAPNTESLDEYSQVIKSEHDGVQFPVAQVILPRDVKGGWLFLSGYIRRGGYRLQPL